jgi:hypothetical protein
MTETPQHPIEIAFPDPTAVIAADAVRYQALPPKERWRKLFSLRAWGTRQAGARAASQRQTAAEARWQEIQRELFARHAR